MDRLLRSAQANIIRKNRTKVAVVENEWVIAVDRAEYLRDYILRLTFSDGKQQDVDFAPFLNQSLNPLIRKYLDVERFKQFTVEYGDLYWDDYDLCFPVADLYEGQVE